MPIIAKDTGGREFKKVPEGVHVAVCNALVDCGVQPGGKFKPRHQVYIRWEVPSERVEFEKDGQHHEGPMQIGKFYTLSLAEKASLRRDLENWRGRAFTREELDGFDLEKVLGTACQICVSHNAQGQEVYANVTGVMGMPKGMQRPQAENPLLYYAPDTPRNFEKLPPWLQERVKGAVTGAPESVSSGRGDREEFDDDIPF